MCEEACPVDAIELTSLYDLIGQEPRGDDLRQGEAAERLRSDEGRRADEVGGRWEARCDTTQHRDRRCLATLLAAAGRVADAAARRGAAGAASARVLAAVGLGLLASQIAARWATGWPTACSDPGRRDGRSRPSATVTFRNPVYCAIWFGLSLLGTAGLFLFHGAQFLAVATVVVYAGAILVTFLFVLMLAQPEGQASYDRVSWEALMSAVDRHGDRRRAAR